MIALTADDTRLLKDVAQYVEPVQVHDTNGKLLGLFVPANRQQQGQSRFDPAELKRRMAEKPAGLFSDLIQCLQRMEEERKRRLAAGEKDFTIEEARAYLEAMKEKQPAGFGN